MKIGIDLREAVNPKSGKGIYTHNLVKNLLKIDRDNEYVLYANAVSADLAVFHNAHIKIIHKPAWLWHFAVIKDFLRENGELFFAPTSYIIPALLPKKIKSVITVHDLVAFLHPHLHQAKAAVLEHLFIRLALRKTKRVLSPSENTKKDLMRIFHYPDAKIVVTPLGVEQAKSTASDLQSVITKYNLPKEFILTVSGLEPRKNVNALIDAMSDIKIPLVIIGGKGWKSQKPQKKIKNAKNIIHIENCDAKDLPAIYSAAKLFVFPSLYEGFGLPPLEAMANGCPVICSNAGSLKEVCGDAALMINPENTKEIAGAIKKILTDEKLSEDLRKKGLARAKTFSWETTAKKTLTAFYAAQQTS